MQVETPSAEKPYDKPESERPGLFIVNTVTNMTKIKHALSAGIPAQRGIED